MLNQAINDSTEEENRDALETSMNSDNALTFETEKLEEKKQNQPLYHDSKSQLEHTESLKGLKLHSHSYHRVEDKHENQTREPSNQA